MKSCNVLILVHQERAGLPTGAGLLAGGGRQGSRLAFACVGADSEDVALLRWCAPCKADRPAYLIIMEG